MSIVHLALTVHFFLLFSLHLGRSGWGCGYIYPTRILFLFLIGTAQFGSWEIETAARTRIATRRSKYLLLHTRIRGISAHHEATNGPNSKVVKTERRNRLVGCHGIPHAERGHDITTVFSFVYIYGGQTSGPNGPRLLVFLCTDPNDTMGGILDGKGFAKPHVHDCAE